MTAIKVTHQDKILDLTQSKISKYSLEKTLKSIKLLTKNKDHSTQTVFINVIRTGLFDIHLHIVDFINYRCKHNVKLSDIDSFPISIWQEKSDFPINISAEPLFRSQPWANSNIDINQLVDVIMLCKRVNDIKAFL